MAPVLYSIDASPPCRAVLMLAKAIGINLKVKDVKLLEGEHLQPPFLKMNPQHTVPTLDDDGFICWDSHAINIYLLEKYGKIDVLYSTDPKKKAVINQRLHFDSGVAFPSLIRIGKPLRQKQFKTIPENLIAEVKETYAHLEAFLQDKQWVCGDKVTVADIQLVSTISSIQTFVPLTDKYPNVTKWLSRCTKEPWYEANLKGLDDFNNIMTSCLNAL